MTSVNSNVAGNVVIPTHSRLSITLIKIVTIADITIEGFAKVIVSGHTEKHNTYLTSESPLCYDKVQQKGNDGPADGQRPADGRGPAVNHPQCIYSFYNL